MHRSSESVGAIAAALAKAQLEIINPEKSPPERLRALLLQAFYTIRSETQLMEQLHDNLLYRSVCRARGRRAGLGADGVHEELPSGDVLGRKKQPAVPYQRWRRAL